MLSTSLALVILLAAGGTAYAVSAYLDAFVAAYPAANGTRIDTCVLCHPTGAGARNAFGSDFGSAGLGNHTFNAALEARDSDGGGSTNLAEITALTFPGDPNDPLPAAPAITTTSPLTAGTVGTAYNQTFAATGGTPPYSWLVTVGTPPAGLTLSAAGVLSGTPTTAGTSNFTVEVTGGASSTRAFVLTINAVAGQDNTAPTVTSRSPANNATGVSVGTAVTATFSEAIAPATVTAASFTLSGGVTGTVSLNPAGTIATFTPSAPLANSTTYTATLTTAITDVAGNALAANSVWTFTTAAAGADTTPPTVTSRSPANNATGVAVGTAVTATFSEAIAPATVTAASFTLSGGVTGTVTLNPAGTIATFTPSAPLADNTTYTATLTTAITDVAGNALAANNVWTFTTAAAGAVVSPPTSDDGGGWFGCAISPSGGGIGGILGTYGPLALLVLGIAFRRRVLRRKE